MEEGNLSQKYTDRLQRWGGAYGKIDDELQGHHPESDRRLLCRYVAAYWYRAGKKWALQRNESAALRGFDNAVSWWPLMLRPRLRRYRLAATCC